MKVILSGSTGYIGQEVLKHCLSHPLITSLILLTRRHPGDQLSKHPNYQKAKIIIVPDFITCYNYDENNKKNNYNNNNELRNLHHDLRTAEAAIWCLGTSYGNEEIDIDYPLAFIRAVKASRATLNTVDVVKPFRYIQLSGALTETPPPQGEPERPLWFFVNGRRVRGRTEVAVLSEDVTITDHDNSPGSNQDQIENRNTFGFSVYLVKPGGVLPKTGLLSFLGHYLFGEDWRIQIDELAAVLVHLAVTGGEGDDEQTKTRKKRVFNNRELIGYGRRLLAATDGKASLADESST